MFARLREVNRWANDSPDYDPAAKAEFADAADSFLVAQAKAGGHTVVTHERISDGRKRIKIPNAAAAHGVAVVHAVPYAAGRAGPVRPRRSRVTAPNSNQLVQKLWNFCNVLRDDGVSTIEYVEQLTYLLFLKMADERQKAGLGEVVPYGLDWQSLLDRDGDELEVHYRHLLESLGRQPGTLGTIFRKAQNRIQDPAKLRRLVVNLINEETWTVGRRRPEGRRLRGPAPEGRRGHQVRRRPVLHAPGADPGDDRLPPTQAGRDDRRPGVRHRWLPARRARVDRRSPHRRDGRRRQALPARRGGARLGDRRRHRPSVRHEPAAPRHRHPDGRRAL